MNRRTFPALGGQVGEIGLGCWQFGGDFGPVEPDEVFRILEAAVDAGVDFFDTADVYGAGRSERLLGEFFAGRRPRPRIATKFGRGPDVWPDRYSRDALRRAVDGALERLRCDALDLLQLHCVPETLLRRGEIFDWLRELREAGLIRAWGASVESDAQAALCLEQPDLASLQIIFNVLRQKPARETLPRAAAQGVAVIVRLPLASGLLSGRYDEHTRFHPQDHRHYNRDGAAFNVGETFAGLPFETGVALVRKLAAFVPEGMSLAQFALRWILDHPEVTVVIPGARRPEQVRANVAAAALPPLPEALHRRLAEFARTEVEPHIRGPY